MLTVDVKDFLSDFHGCNLYSKCVHMNGNVFEIGKIIANKNFVICAIVELPSKILIFIYNYSEHEFAELDQFDEATSAPYKGSFFHVIRAFQTKFLKELPFLLGKEPTSKETQAPGKCFLV